MEGLSAPLPSSEPCKGSQTIQGHRQHGGPVRADGAKLTTATLSTSTRGLPASMWEVAQKVAPWAAAAAAVLTGTGVVVLRLQGKQRADQAAVRALEGKVAHLEQQVASAQGQQAGAAFLLNQCRLELAATKQQLRQTDTQVARLCDQVWGLVQQLSAAEAAAATAQAAAKASAAKAARASAAAAAAKKAKRLALCAKHAAATQAQADVAAAEQRAEAAQQCSVAAQAEAAAASAAQAAAEQRAEAAQQRAVAAEAEAAAASAAKLAAEQAGVTAVTHMRSSLGALSQQLEEAVARAATADSAAASNAAAAVEVAGQLAEALQQAGAEREALQQEVGALQAQVMQLEADLLQQHAATTAAQGRADATATSAAATEAALADVQQRLGAATAALQSRDQEVANLSARLQQQQEALLAAQAAREEAAREAEAAAARAVATERQLQASEEASVEMRGSEEALRAQLSAAEEAAAVAKAQAAATSAQAEAKVAAAEGQAASLQQQLQALRSIVGAAEAAKVAAVEQAAQLAADLDWERQEGKELEMRLASVLAAAVEIQQAAMARPEKGVAAALVAANAAAATAQEEAAALRRELEALQASAAAPGGGLVRQEAPAALLQQPQNSEGGEVEAPGLSSSSSRTQKRNQRRRRAATKSNTSSAPSIVAAPAAANIESAIVPAVAAVAAPCSHAAVLAADGSGAAGAAEMGVIVGGSGGQQQAAMAPAVSIDVSSVASDMAGLSVPLRLPVMAAAVHAMVASGHTAMAEEACTQALQLANSYMAVAAPLVAQGEEAEGAHQQLRGALCQLLQQVAAVVAPLHPATADLQLRQAATLAPGGQLTTASKELAANIAEQLGWFGKAAQLLQPILPVQWQSLPHYVAMRRRLPGAQAVVVTAVQLLARRPAFGEYVAVLGVLGQVRTLRAAYPHSQLLLLLEALLCVQLQQAAGVMAAIRSVPTCSPQLAAALTAAGGAPYDIAGQSIPFWLAWLGSQCGLVAERCNLQSRSLQVVASATMYTAAPAPVYMCMGGGNAAAAATSAARSEYVALLGGLYPTRDSLQLALAGLEQLLGEQEAADALKADLACSQDVSTVAVVPLHPFWAAEVYMTPGKTYQRKAQAPQAIHSFTLAAALSKAARPAFAAVAYCCIGQVLLQSGLHQGARQASAESMKLWPFELEPATKALRVRLGQVSGVEAMPESASVKKKVRHACLLTIHPDKVKPGSCVFGQQVAPLLPGWQARWDATLLTQSVKDTRNHVCGLFY